MNASSTGPGMSTEISCKIFDVSFDLFQIRVYVMAFQAINICQTYAFLGLVRPQNKCIMNGSSYVFRIFAELRAPCSGALLHSESLIAMKLMGKQQIFRGMSSSFHNYSVKNKYKGTEREIFICSVLKACLLHLWRMKDFSRECLVMLFASDKSHLGTWQHLQHLKICWSSTHHQLSRASGHMEFEKKLSYTMINV